MKKFKKILLIDDDPVTAFLNKCLISKYGISQVIDTAPSEQEGLDWIYVNCRKNLKNRRLQTDMLVFSDLSMTAMSGFALLETILDLEQQELIEAPNFYFLTSTEDCKHAITHTRYPVHGYFTKTLTLEDIRLLITTESCYARFQENIFQSLIFT